MRSIKQPVQKKEPNSSPESSEQSPPEVFQNPKYLFLTIILIIFLSEFIIMLVLELLPSISLFKQAIVDSMMLTVLLFPLLFFLVYKPFKWYIDKQKKAENNLAISEMRFRDIAENAREWIWEVDAEGKYTYASPIVEKILGHTSEEVIGKHFYDFFHPDDRDQLKKGAFEAFSKKQSFRDFINRNIHKNGRTVWLSTSGIPILDNDGELLGYRGADMDITDRKLSEDSLKASEEKAKAVADTSMDAIIMMDGKGIISYFNAAAEKIFGYSRDEVVGEKLHSYLVSENSRKQYYKKLPEFKKTGQCKVIGKALQLNGYKKDGTKVPVELSVSSFQIKGEWHSVGTVRDITQRMIMEEKLREAAITDELTGLLNRRGFHTLAKQQCKIADRNKRKISLLYADLDNLKTINDELGHNEGDRAIVDIAHILVKTFRESDIIGRIGGDEFAVLLTEISEPNSEKTIINHILNNLKIHNDKISDRKYILSLSIGIAQYDPAYRCNLDELFALADKHMYEQKALKKNS